MDNNFIESVKELFENPGKMDPEQIRKLISETNQYFAKLYESYESDDPKAKESAFKDAIELKEFLESKIHIFSPFMEKEPSNEEEAMIAEINENLRINNK